MLVAALPGSLYIYQGDELGLPEVEDLPVELIQDPMHYRSGGIDPGRDGCRVPLPWSGDHAPFGFSPEGVRHLAAPARGVGIAHGRGAARGPGLDAEPLSRGAPPAARAPRTRRRSRSNGGMTPFPVPRMCSRSAAARASRASSTPATSPCRSRPAPPFSSRVHRSRASAPVGDAARRVALPGDSTAWLRIDDPTVTADAAASRAATDTTPTTEVSAPRG